MLMTVTAIVASAAASAIENRNMKNPPPKSQYNIFEPSWGADKEDIIVS
jgi:hypothetical protein